MRGIKAVRLWLVAIGAIFLVMDIAAAALLLSPAGRSRAAKEQQFSMLRTESLAKRKEAMPARDMDAKLKSAKQQVGSFYDERLPRYYSQISEVLGKEAATNHVQLSAVKYEPSKDQRNVQASRKENRVETGIQPLDVIVDVDGNYADQVRFLNSLERSKLFFIPAQVNFGGQQQTGLRVTLRLQTFLRTGA